MDLSSQLRNFSQKIKISSTEHLITALLNLLPRASDEILIQALYLLDRLARTEQKKETIGIVRKAFESNHPTKNLALRLLRELHPNCKKGLMINFIVQSILADADKRKEYQEKYGVMPPFVVLISPTMRCNLRCRGCYAANYTRSSDLEPAIIDKVIDQCRQIGCHFITLVGGEPFLYEPLFEIFERHNDVVFQVFTNGTLIDQNIAQKLVELGNVAPAISIEGFEEETDLRRGRGVFDKVMRAMDSLRREGALFFFSVCTTRQNYKDAVSDRFVDLMVEKGAALGWYFNYMPVGRRPELDLMPTPEQRNYIRRRVSQLRTEKPILLIDFWGDGPLVDGCLAGGKLYLHITNNGDVEPCIFCHFAVDNIKEKNLEEVLNSNFFKAIRRAQPFGHNDIRPCPLIDHPGAMAGLIKKYQAQPTHKEAEGLITDLIPPLREYAKEVAKMYREVWQEEYQRVQCWKEGYRKGAN